MTKKIVKRQNDSAHNEELKLAQEYIDSVYPGYQAQLVPTGDGWDFQMVDNRGFLAVIIAKSQHGSTAVEAIEKFMGAEEAATRG